ncbi:expressed unknown protein [Ectocarpus siliculosus]|uniref:Uncharacterized protein n=1 Tax=Ectocarpus siliculosus TaxID=2880 RepID=D8LEV1_ECTSI|nr:expressed unknown protein [Ectocarpus siliculosus]|eukprot:CBN79771.1 expressed unknown protein [Ectocarpus siliculosus]
MARSTGEGGSAANGKKKASATKKPRGSSAKKGSPAPSKRKAAGAKGKGRRRVSDDQIANQLKARLKDVVGRFEEAYPEGLDFAPNSNDADFA